MTPSYKAGFASVATVLVGAFVVAAISIDLTAAFTIVGTVVGTLVGCVALLSFWHWVFRPRTP